MFENLTIDSTLEDLPSNNRKVEDTTLGREVRSIFDTDRHLPGILVMKNDSLRGMISRETFFEKTGRLFGPEVFLSRQIKEMLELVPRQPLILAETCLITLATQQALGREGASIYEPVVIEKPGKDYSLIGALTLFMTQSQQLTNLHNRRRFTVDSGQTITDEQAAEQFIAFASLNHGFDPKRCLTRHSLRCDHCGQSVSYSIADIVRSFPQLIKGIAIEEGMSTRSYRFYVRHRCGKEIWEIPVEHDGQLEYRSQRSARLVENDV